MPQLATPQTWGEVVEFIKEKGLDREEYFELDWKVSRISPVWTPLTRWITIWLAEGSNEGFYLHIDEIKLYEESGQRREGKREPRALGKFWDYREALKAQALLWGYIYGFPVEPQPEPPTVKVEQFSLRILDEVSRRQKRRLATEDESLYKYLKGFEDGLLSARDYLVWQLEEEPQPEEVEEPPLLEWRGG